MGLHRFMGLNYTMGTNLTIKRSPEKGQKSVGNSGHVEYPPGDKKWDKEL